MRRARSILAILVAALAWAATTACNQQTIQTPIRSFDRPSDVALTCAQYFTDQNGFNVRPLGDCDPNVAATLTQPASADPSFAVPLGPNPYTPFVVALVTQSARGELALVDGAQNRLIDVDPLKPGYGFLPVGRLPEHVRTSADGCFAVTANTDSCDFGVVDISTVLTNAVVRQLPRDMGTPAGATDLANGVDRILARLPAPGGGVRTLYARPSWIEVAADETAATHGYDSSGVAGQCTGGVHKVWAALPGCQLVVKLRVDRLDSSQPNVEAAIQVTTTGARVISDLTTLSCPVECAGAPQDPSAVFDLSPAPSAPSDMGSNLPTTQAFPGTLSVDGEGGRLIIGDLFGERLDIVPMNSAGALGTPRAVHLESGAGGVRVARVGPRSAAGKFLYAIARDGSIRVVDLDREVECETNPDPRFSGGGIDLQQTPDLDHLDQWPDATAQARTLGCFPLGLPSTPPRSALARTPGITLAQGQLPTDIAFVHGSVPPISATSNVAPPVAGPGLLVGDFAWIISSDGRATVVNIYDACPAPNQQNVFQTMPPYSDTCASGNVATSIKQTLVQFGHPQPLIFDRVAHRIRAGHARFGAPQAAGDSAGQPRVVNELSPCAVAVPSTSPGAPDGGVPDAGVGVCGGSAALPSFYAETLPQSFIDQTVNPQHTDDAPTRIVRFVDPDRVRDETWVASWEGTLPGTDRALGAPRPGGFFSDAGGQWCTRGVLAGDKLVLRGCGDDAECDQAGGFQCIHDPGAFPDVSQGMCLPIDGRTLTPDFWSGQCGKLLRTQRKFRITSAKQGQTPPWDPGSPPLDYLALAEIYEPEFAEQTHGCALDKDCADVTIATSGTTSPDGGVPPAGATSCVPDFDGVKRCLRVCAVDGDCGRDFECAKSTQGDMRCVRAPLDDELFFNLMTVQPGQHGCPSGGPPCSRGCVQELQQYDIRAGASFLVGGTGSGILVSGVADAGGECRMPAPTTSYARERQARLPLKPDNDCPASVAQTPLASLPLSSPSNVCKIEAGGVRIVHYENPLFNIALQIPEFGSRIIVPPDGTSISMQITGGGTSMSIPLGVDVQAQQPRFVAVAPDHQTVYIVDEGKSISAAGLRGQLLRLFTPSQSMDRLFIVR
jgi:hypothetical protein